jgi:5-methylcytosine-specific restriction endonuclease McrA
MDRIKREEITSFFENLYTLFISKLSMNNGSDMYVRNDTNFLDKIFGNISLQYNQYTNFTNIQNSARRIYSDYKFGLSNFSYELNALTECFSYPATYEIFKIIKRIFLEDNYKLEEHIVNKRFNYEQYNVPNVTSNINDLIIQDIYLYSVNKLLLNIFIKWNQNYDKYIKQQNGYYNLMDSYKNIISKHNMQHLQPYINNCGSGNEFKYPISCLLFGCWINIDYQSFNDIWTLFNSYLTILNDEDKLLNKIVESQILSEPVEQIKIENKNEPKEINIIPIEQIKIKDNKSKREKVPSTVRNSLWKDYFGQSIQGVCQCCKREDITMANFEAGHIISVKDGGENQLSNLKPVCSQCNKSMGSTNMDSFIKKHGFDVEPPIKKLDNIEDEIKKELLSMNNDKLKLVCKNINIKVTYNNKTECIDAIKSFFDKKNKDDLVELCKSKSINYSGNKIKLIINLIKNSVEINI